MSDIVPKIAVLASTPESEVEPLVQASGSQLPHASFQNLKSSALRSRRG